MSDTDRAIGHDVGNGLRHGQPAEAQVAPEQRHRHLGEVGGQDPKRHQRYDLGYARNPDQLRQQRRRRDQGQRDQRAPADKEQERSGDVSLVDRLALNEGLPDTKLADQIGDTHHDQGAADDPERLRPEQARKQDQGDDLHRALGRACGQAARGSHGSRAATAARWTSVRQRAGAA